MTRNERATTHRPRRLPLLGLVSLLVATALFGACKNESPQAEAQRDAYLRYCAACHGDEGEGIASIANAPILASDDLLTIADDAFLRDSIALGRPGTSGRDKPGTKMSPLGESQRGPLSDDDIDGIVAHMRSWQKGPTETLDASYVANGDTEAGRETYDAECAACHGPAGWGVLAPRLAGETFQDTASDDFIRQSILRGRSGTTMRAYEMDESTLADLISYIRTLRGESEG